jgi:hypothetical protein
MATTSTRSLVIGFSGDVTFAETISAAQNLSSPGQVQIFTLTGGTNNTITLPTGGSVVTGAVIIPPAGNTVLIYLKGASGDTGIPIHKTDPTSIAFDSSASSFVLTPALIVTGLRIIFT